MKQFFSKKTLSLGLAAGFALTLYGCGGGGGSDAPDLVLSAIKTVPTVKKVPFDSPSPAVCPTSSHPFSTMLCSRGETLVTVDGALVPDPEGKKPLDIKKDYGYVEEEFFLSGKANIYNLDANERAEVSSSGNDYTTRLLVRYPADPAKFNGRVYIDILNASSNVDLEDTWRRSWKHMMENGYAFIGITSKSVTANSLKKFDPARYADLKWQVAGKDENGLFWDMLSQLGTMLREPGAGKLLGGMEPKYVYLGGQSQSGFYMNTYITAFSDRLEKARKDGKPLFDGYVNLVGPGSTPIRSDAKAGPLKLYKATSVPQIAIMSEAESRFYEMGMVPYERRADANSATDKFRFYEVTATPHSDPTSPIIPNDAEIIKAKGSGRPPKVYAPGHEETALQLDEFVTAALENIHAWAKDGKAAPPADKYWIDYKVTKDSKGNNTYVPNADAYGNTLKGLRSPLIEAPLYRFYGTAPVVKNAEGTVISDWLVGSMIRFDTATINALYPNGKAEFLSKFNTAADARVAEGYLLAKDVARMKQWAVQEANKVWPAP